MKTRGYFEQLLLDIKIKNLLYETGIAESPLEKVLTAIQQNNNVEYFSNISTFEV